MKQEQQISGLKTNSSDEDLKRNERKLDQTIKENNLMNYERSWEDDRL
jgi:hypothetical protein